MYIIIYHPFYPPPLSKHLSNPFLPPYPQTFMVCLLTFIFFKFMVFSLCWLAIPGHEGYHCVLLILNAIPLKISYFLFLRNNQISIVRELRVGFSVYLFFTKVLSGLIFNRPCAYVPLPYCVLKILFSWISTPSQVLTIFLPPIPNKYLRLQDGV